MRMRASYPLGLAMALAAFGATALGATTIDPPTHADDDVVRVVNNYGALVNVYVEDANGRLHKLGRVSRGTLEEFEIPEALATPSFRIKVYPAHPLWANADDFGIKSQPLDFRRDSQVVFWLEPDLTQSVVEVMRD